MVDAFTPSIDIHTIPQVHALFLQLYKIEYNPVEVSKSLPDFTNHSSLQLESYTDYLLQSGNNVNLLYFKHCLPVSELQESIKQSTYPMLAFLSKAGETIPVIIQVQKKKLLKVYYLQGEGIIEQEEVDITLLLQELITAKEAETKEEKVTVITCFPKVSLYSEESSGNSLPAAKLSPLSRLLRLLASEKREITYLYLYAIISGIISLSLPLGIQSIIGFVSSGQMATSVYVLLAFIILGILLTGGLQIMQLSLVEQIQQRIFTKTAFEFAFRIPKFNIESLLAQYPPELINRFFDTITLQKGLAKILIDFSAALLQILFGLILLSLYHPYFIFFGILLLSILILILRLTGAKGLKTSLYESKYKYRLVGWLEELARSLSAFKLAGYANLAMEKTDYFVSHYLQARKNHFGVLISQYVSFVGFKTLITGGLLVLGCILLINQEINIGQFVASEIIVILIISAIEKLLIKLDVIYDVLTSAEKIGAVTDLPLDREVSHGIPIGHLPEKKGFSIGIKKLNYTFPGSKEKVLEEINLSVSQSEKLCIAGYDGAGKTTLLNVLTGQLSSYEGVITFNGISLREADKSSFHASMSETFSQQGLFDGTIVENITLGLHGVKIEDILSATDCVGLTAFIGSLPQGFNTPLTGGGMRLPGTVSRKLLLSRSLVKKPKLLLLDDFLLGVEKGEKERIFKNILSMYPDCTLLVVSNEPFIMKLCNQVILLKEGQIISKGPYEHLLSEESFLQPINHD